MLSAAAKRMGVTKADLTISDGVIQAQSSNLGYGELVSRKRLSLKVDKNAKLKKPADYTIVGKSITRRGLPGKITGDFVYMHDLRVPDMAYGVVVRPPAIRATLEEVDENSISHLPDVVKVVRKGNFLGVVTESEWSAVRAGRELGVKWSTAESLPDQSRLWEHVRNTKIVKDDVTSDISDVDSALNRSGHIIKATYDFALHTHGSIGPSGAIADFSGGKLVSWSSSQATHRLRRQFSDMFSIPEEDIRCFYLEGAGCYGRNGHEDAAADAALLSREVGRPVRVQWMRHDEHGWDPKGPPTLIDLQAQINDHDQVSAWQSAFFIPQGAGGRVSLLPATLADLPTTSKLNPGGITNDSAIPYQFPNVRTVCHRLETTPLRPSWIRSPGRMQNTFANEAFVDEIAAKLRVDPIEYRRQRIDSSDTRGHDVLDRPEEVPCGVGEPAAAIVSACISNAVFDATGAKLRSVPFKPEKVRAGLSALRG